MLCVKLQREHEKKFSINSAEMGETQWSLSPLNQQPVACKVHSHVLKRRLLRRIHERSAISNDLGQECTGYVFVHEPVAKESPLNYTHLTREER